MTEERLNRLLRQVDWRFLLHRREAPKTLDLSEGRLSEALRLIGPPAERADSAADLVVLGFPTRRQAGSARRALRPGGEVACLWGLPRPGGVRRARARLRRAGFSGIRFYRTGPQPGEAELWLPVDAPEIAKRALAESPPRSRREAIARRAWRLLAPVCAIAHLPAPAEQAATSEGDELPDPEAWVLLTGGAESDAKVVGFPYGADSEEPDAVAKFARIAKSDAALEREAELLSQLERERPSLAGAPRLRARGHRAGQVAIVQDAVHGKALNTTMDRAGFEAHAPRVTRWLLALAGEPDPQPPASWASRLISEPLDELEDDYGTLLPANLPARAREALAGIGDLSLVWEHRDFGPWNVVIANSGDLATIDWEDAEPHGLPGLDLAYFLASAAFGIDGVPAGANRIERARESNRRLRDPGTELGAVAAACIEEYRGGLGIGAEDFQRLRVLCWLVQAVIACRRLPNAVPASVPAAADAELFAHLAEDELQALEGAT